jgi:hypothetical protein
MKERPYTRKFERLNPGNKCKGKLILSDDVKIKDISLGGLCIETTRRLNINNSYKIQIVSNDKKDIITPLGLLVRAKLKGTVKKKDYTLPLYEVALKFIELNDKEKLFLDKLISGLK